MTLLRSRPVRLGEARTPGGENGGGLKEVKVAGGGDVFFWGGGTSLYITQ